MIDERQEWFSSLSGEKVNLPIFRQKEGLSKDGAGKMKTELGSAMPPPLSPSEHGSRSPHPCGTFSAQEQHWGEGRSPTVPVPRALNHIEKEEIEIEWKSGSKTLPSLKPTTGMSTPPSKWVHRFTFSSGEGGGANLGGIHQDWLEIDIGGQAQEEALNPVLEASSSLKFEKPSWTEPRMGPPLCLGGGPSLEGLWPGIQADDFLEVPDKLAQAVHVRVDVLLHPFLHGVREVDALQVRAQSLDGVLPVFMDSGGKERDTCLRLGGRERAPAPLRAP